MLGDVISMFKGAIPFLLKKMPEQAQDFFTKTGISDPAFIKKCFEKQVTKQDILGISTKILVHSEKHIVTAFDFLYQKTGVEMIISFDANLVSQSIEIVFLEKENNQELFRMPITQLPEFVNQFMANHDANPNQLPQ